MVLLRDLVQHVITNAADANLQRRTKLSMHDISEDAKLQAQSRLFYLFEEQPVWTKNALQAALQLDSKFVTYLLKECCVRHNKHKWVLHPDYVVDI